MKISKNNYMYILYSYKKDGRNIYMPDLFKNKPYIILQYWNKDNIKTKIENKYNKKGFIIFEKNKYDIYCKMLIGKTINFRRFIKMLKTGIAIFDSGMYQGNSRNYSQFRATNRIWKKLIIEEY